MTIRVVMRLQHRVHEGTLREPHGFSSLEKRQLRSSHRGHPLSEWWSRKKQRLFQRQTRTGHEETDNMLQDGTFQLGMKKFLH